MSIEKKNSPETNSPEITNAAKKTAQDQISQEKNSPHKTVQGVRVGGRRGVNGLTSRLGKFRANIFNGTPIIYARHIERCVLPLTELNL